jgi:hypothetical protein
MRDTQKSVLKTKCAIRVTDKWIDIMTKEGGGHYYREVRDEREIGLTGSNNGSSSMGRHSQEPETDRGKELDN